MSKKKHFSSINQTLKLFIQGQQIARFYQEVKEWVDKSHENASKLPVIKFVR